ncbi:hypothetical protein PMAYCL1PPCAC_31404, partial [Pristionchus mayeri]
LATLFALLSNAQSQNVLQFPRLLQERNDLWTTVIQNNHSHISGLSSSIQLFSFDVFLDAVGANRGDSLSPECQEDIAALISALLGKFEYPEFAEQVWFPMHDSSGKIHQAILKGHIYFAGHFSECVEIDTKLTGRDRPFRADYFKIEVDILFRSNAKNGSCEVTDAGQVLGWSLGICLPASCSSEELESLLSVDSAKHNPICAVYRTNDHIENRSVGFYVTISVLGVVFTLCALSGIADFFLSDSLSDKPVSASLIWRLFIAFSLYSNVASIFDTSGATKEGQIWPIHCMRFFSMCWVVLGHLTVEMSGVIANPLDVFERTQDLITVFILNAFFAVDTFFFIGGLLLAFLWQTMDSRFNVQPFLRFKNYIRNPKQTNSPGAWLMFYVHRILRLSPPYYMTVLFCAFVWNQFFRDSPFSLNLVVPAISNNCRDTWWLEFTYMQNIFKTDYQCLPVSWYLATDIQIFLFTPLLILPLACKPLLGFAVAVVIFSISSGLNIFLVYHYHWPASLMFIGGSDPEMTNFNNYDLYMYCSPIIRCQVYIIGMLVGWFLQSKKRMRINPIINVILWITSVVLMLTVILDLHSQTTGHLIPIFWRAMYSVFSKPVWALALSWIIISCYYGYGGPINSFMSWHIFWSACFEISFGKVDMLFLGGHRMGVTTTEENSIKIISSKDLDNQEEAVHVKMRM